MGSGPGTAWRLVAKRAAANRLILTAALVTVILATTLLAAGPIYSDAVAISGSQRALAEASVRDVNVEISLRTPAAGYEANAELVAAELPNTFGLTGGSVSHSIISGSYELPTRRVEEFTDVAVFQFVGTVEEHATLVDGRWPDSGDEPYQSAVSDSTAVTLGLDVGDQLVVTSRADETDRPAVEIVGIFSIDDPNDPFWYEDELITGGVVEGRTFRTFGPFLVDFEPMLSRFSQINSVLRWRIFPHYDELDLSAVSEMRRRLEGLEPRLNSATEQNLSYLVETRAPQILGDIERSVNTTRTGVLTLTVQLAILAGYALLLTAGLLVESRRSETALLRLRGASNRQVFAMAAMEGLILTVPAALAAPWLATLALRILNQVGPLASIDLAIDPAVSRSSYGLAFLAAAGCVVALAVPALRSAQALNESRAAKGRQRTRGILQQAGVDLALLAIAGLVFWQLRRHGATITSTVQDRIGIDPLLIAAPALVMLAGSMLALRSIPLLARVAEGVAGRGKSTVRALAAWQVARRPTRQARAALLLIMALGIGVFATGYTVTWKQSQADQADYQVGADVRVVPNRRLNDSIPEMNLQNAHEQLGTLRVSMPVAREAGQLSQALGSAQFVMLDARQAADVVRIRGDLSSEPFELLMEDLATQRPTLPHLPIPGEPHRLGLDVMVDLDPLPEDFARPEGLPESRVAFAPRARLVIQDGNGLLHRVELGNMPIDSGRVRLVADLAHSLGDATVATPTYPIALVEIEIVSPAPFLVARTATIEVSGLFATGSGTQDDWQRIDAALEPASWALGHTGLAPAVAGPAASYLADQPEAGLAFAVDSGIGRGPLVLPVNYGLRPGLRQLPEEFPVVVSERLLQSTESKVGDDVQLRGLRGIDQTARIVGSVAGFPTVHPDSREVIVVDLPTIQMLSFETGGPITEVDERWISVGTADGTAVAADLEMAPYETHRVFDRADRVETLQLDPVALGTIGSLALGFVAAAVFAATGFAVSAVVSARERLTEFALLRAVGLSTRQLGNWMSLEHGVLVILSLIFGSAVGLLLVWMILPLIVITQDATEAVPGVIVSYPWGTMVALQAAIAAVLAAIVALVAAALRRSGLGSLLRMGDE